MTRLLGSQNVGLYQNYLTSLKNINTIVECNWYYISNLEGTVFLKRCQVLTVFFLLFLKYLNYFKRSRILSTYKGSKKGKKYNKCCFQILAIYILMHDFHFLNFFQPTVKDSYFAAVILFTTIQFQACIK